MDVLLRMREARFFARGAPVGPITLDLQHRERAERAFATGREASIAAMMAAGIVKAGEGSVLLGSYDPRVQPVHCKRIAAYVPHDPLPLEDTDFEGYIAYRAALWGIDRARAVALAHLVLQRLDGVHEAFAYPIAGALIGSPQLLVLDRPAPAYARCIIDAAGPRAVLSTHAGEAAAAAFAAASELVNA